MNTAVAESLAGARQRWRRLLIVCLALATIGCGSDKTNPTTPAPSASPAAAAPRPKPIDAKNPIVRIETNQGPITLKLDGVNARGTVRNFLNYATEGFYDNTIVHYVVPGKMVVAGGYSTDRQAKPPRTAIRNEAHNGLKNVRGAIAMARDPATIDSATSQFFINLEDAPQRDHQGETPDKYGYCVFGQVTAGLEVVDKISKSPTAHLEGDLAETPDPPIVITSIRVVPES
jgi:cyclophilin family peptidyl-prolyl cis-trans isomerase